jgi:hypothetical protein
VAVFVVVLCAALTACSSPEQIAKANALADVTTCLAADEIIVAAGGDINGLDSDPTGIFGTGRLIYGRVSDLSDLTANDPDLVQAISRVSNALQNFTDRVWAITDGKAPNDLTAVNAENQLAADAFAQVCGRPPVDLHYQ